MFRSFVICAALVVAGAACKNTYRQEVTDTTPMPPPMNSRTRIYIAMPEDALDKKESVPNSGKRTAQAINEAFLRHTKLVTAATAPATLNDALEHARRLPADFLVVPTIFEWKDRSTEWTGVRDRLGLQIDVVDATNGQTVRTTKIHGTSRWMTDGGDAPQDLLADPVDKFVRSLFRVVMTPSALQKR